MRISTLVLALAGLLAAVPAAAVDRVVDDAGVPCISGAPVYTTISGAVAAASAGETILVCAGTYFDNVTVAKPKLKLQAQGVVKVHSIAADLPVFFIVFADGVTVQGFDIAAPGSPCGLEVNSAAGVEIRDNKVRDSANGICGDFSQDLRIRYNVVNADFTGILLVVTGSEVANNTIAIDGPGTGGGIAAHFCDGLPVKIHHNLLIAKVESPFSGHGIFAAACAATIANNTVRGTRPLTPGLRGIALEQADGTVVTTNQVQYAEIGLQIDNSPGAVISFNSLSSNNVGLDIVNTAGVTVTRNNATRSTVVDCRWDGNGANILTNNNCGTQDPAGAFD